MSDFLDRMAAVSRARAGAARRKVGEARLLESATMIPPPLPLTLSGFDLIAELKLRSPASGELAGRVFDRQAQVALYARSGAAAVSVLTEPDQFRGSLEHLHDAATILRPLGVPVMRKDFLTDPYQVIEARVYGASGVLLIVTMLDDGILDAMLACAAELGLFVLLEGFDHADLERIAALDLSAFGPRALAGVNCRNLKTLEVDFDRFVALAPALPNGLPTVAESGLGKTADIETVAGLGYRLALVGSALMQAEDAAATMAGFLAAGRAKAGQLN